MYNIFNVPYQYIIVEEKSGHRNGVGVLFLGKIFTTEMLKVKETPMTQYITYRRNQTVPVLIERIIKIFVFCLRGEHVRLKFYFGRVLNLLFYDFPSQTMYFDRFFFYLLGKTVPILPLLQQKSISSHFLFQSLNNFLTDVRNTQHNHMCIEKRFSFLVAFTELSY